MTIPAIAAAAVVVGTVSIFVVTSGGGEDSTIPAGASPAAQQAGDGGVQAGGSADTARSADLQPTAPTTGRVTVSRLPAGGTITIDGARRTGTEFDLEPGPHRIEMRARTFQTYAVNVDIAAGVAVPLSFPRIQVVQQPARAMPRPAAQNPGPAERQPPAGPQYAWLRIGVRSGGEIFIDGQSYGERRTITQRVTAGVAHSIQVRSNGAVADTTVTLSAGDTTLVVLRPRRP